MKKARTILGVVCAPVHLIGGALYRVVPHNKKAGHVVIGASLMFTGTTLSVVFKALAHGNVFVEIISDTVCFGLHGLGAAPIVKVIANKAGVEI